MKSSLFRKVILVLDSADSSLPAAEFAVRMSQETGCEVHALYVVDTPTLEYLTRMRVLVADEAQDFERDLQTTAERLLEYVRTMATERDVKLRTQVQKGALHQVARRLAQEIEADAIVLGSWKMSAMQNDSTAASRQLVLEDATCPVIVIHG